MGAVTHPAIPGSAGRMRVGPDGGAVVAYRVWIGMGEEAAGTMQVWPMMRHMETQPTSPEEIRMPAFGEILVIPTFLTRAHVTIDVDMQYNAW